MLTAADSVSDFLRTVQAKLDQTRTVALVILTEVRDAKRFSKLAVAVELDSGEKARVLLTHVELERRLCIEGALAVAWDLGNMLDDEDYQTRAKRVSLVDLVLDKADHEQQTA